MPHTVVIGGRGGSAPRAEAFLALIFSCILRAVLAHSRAVSIGLALICAPAVRVSHSSIIALSLISITFLLEGILATDALGARKRLNTSAAASEGTAGKTVSGGGTTNTIAPPSLPASTSTSLTSTGNDDVTWQSAPNRNTLNANSTKSATSVGAALIFIPPTTIDGVHVPGAYVTHAALRARLARESFSTPFVDAISACNERVRRRITACFSTTSVVTTTSTPLARVIGAVKMTFVSVTKIVIKGVYIIYNSIDAADGAAFIGGITSPFAAAAALGLGSLTTAAPLVALLAVPASILINDSTTSDGMLWITDEPRRAALVTPRVVTSLLRLTLWCLIAPALIAGALLLTPVQTLVWAPTLEAAASAVNAERNATAWEAIVTDPEVDWLHTVAAVAITPTLGEWPTQKSDSDYALLSAWPAAAPWVISASLLVGRTTGILFSAALLPTLLAPLLAALLARASQGDGLSFTWAGFVSAMSRLALQAGFAGRRATRSAALTRPGWQRPGVITSPTAASSVTAAIADSTASTTVISGITPLFRLPRSVRSSLRWIAHALAATALALALSDPLDGSSSAWLSSPITLTADAPRIVADLAAAATGNLPSTRSISSVPAAAALAEVLTAATSASPNINESIFAGAAAAASSVVALTAIAAAILNYFWRTSQISTLDLFSVAFRETARHFPAGLALALSFAIQPLPNSPIILASPILTASIAAAFAFATLLSTVALIACDAAAVSMSLFHGAARDAAAAGFDVAAVARAVAGVVDVATVPVSSATMPSAPPQLSSAQLKRLNVIAAGLARLRFRCILHGTAVALSIETYSEARLRVTGTFGIISTDTPTAITIRKELNVTPAEPSPVVSEDTLSTPSAHIRGTDAYAPALGSFRVGRQTLTPTALVRASSATLDARVGGGGGGSSRALSRTRSPPPVSSRRKGTRASHDTQRITVRSTDSSGVSVEIEEEENGEEHGAREGAEQISTEIGTAKNEVIATTEPNQRPLLVAVHDPSGRAPFLLVPWTKPDNEVGGGVVPNPPQTPTSTRSLPLPPPLQLVNGTGFDSISSSSRTIGTSHWAPSTSTIPMRNGNANVAAALAQANIPPVTPLSVARSALAGSLSPTLSVRGRTTNSMTAREDTPQKNSSWPQAPPPTTTEAGRLTTAAVSTSAYTPTAITTAAIGSANPLLARARALLAAAHTSSSNEVETVDTN